MDLYQSKKLIHRGLLHMCRDIASVQLENVENYIIDIKSMCHD